MGALQKELLSLFADIGERFTEEMPCELRTDLLFFSAIMSQTKGNVSLSLFHIILDFKSRYFTSEEPKVQWDKVTC